MNSSVTDLLNFSFTSQQNFTAGSNTLGWHFQRLGKGQSCGVDKLTARCGSKSIEILPTRGMGIWQAKKGDVRFGWDSPVSGPIHPMWVDVNEPSGLGWLDGFDEMMVRCGLASNGAPEFDKNGQLALPLHGRIANLPANQLTVEIDDDQGKIIVRGTVVENRFHFHRLQLKTTISMQLDSDEISITDCVTNLSDRSDSIQMLYHNNFGSPILEKGSRFFAPVRKLVPRNPHAASGLERWNQYEAPDPNYAEQVYFMELAADFKQESLAMLSNAQQTKAVSIRHNISQLPFFSLWKNTAGTSDGYVTGLEPATNFPNPHSFEKQHDRTIQLKPGSDYTMSLNIGLLTEPKAIQTALEKIETLQPKTTEIHDSPTDDWCST